MERASADAARQHAKADAMARAAKKNKDAPAQPQLADIERLKVCDPLQGSIEAENEAVMLLRLRMSVSKSNF